MGFIGDTLRRERLKSGLELERIAQQTKIPARLLLAIEREEFDKLPGGFLTTSFVRQYAHTLGLDEEPMIAELRGQPEPEEPVASPTVPKRHPAWAPVLIVGAILVSALLYAEWPTGGSAPVAAAQKPSAPTKPATVAVPPSALPTPKTAEPAAAEVASEPVTPRLALKALEPTWVSVTRNGKSLFSGILQKNETLEAADAVKLVIANPANVEITLNGKPVGPIGPRGRVSEAQITPDGNVRILPHKPVLEDIL